MPYILVRHKVRDYTKWKAIYEYHGKTRAQAGGKGGQVFQSAENPNELIVLLEWDNLENARQFIESDDLRETMQRAGVSDKPTVFYLNAT